MSRIKPILFNTEMVRSILKDRKTVTRRAVKLKFNNTHHEMHTDKYGTRLIEIQNDVEGETYGTRPDGTRWRSIRGYVEPNPPCRKGDILYVRETWNICNMDCEENTIAFIYKASSDEKEEGCRTVKVSDEVYEKFEKQMTEYTPGWRPSIHMPKEAARIWLRVTDVRVERLQDVTNEQILREGISETTIKSYIQQMPEESDECTRFDHYIAFQIVWDSTIKKSELGHYGWDANPFVWVIEFERCENPEGDL